MNPKQIARTHKTLYSFIALTALLVIFLSQIQFAAAQTTATAGYTVFTTSPALNTIPANSVYTRETRIGSFRPGYQEWACPVFRIPANEVNAMVTVTNTSSGRVETWPIPTYAVPANAADGHMCVVNLNTQTVYEFFEAVWSGSRTITAGGMVSFPMNSNGISNPTHRRVTASGFANMFGMIKREDFLMANGQLDPNNTVIRHALTMNLPPAILGNDTFISPAVGGEVAGNSSSNGIPMGALFALPRNLNVDALNVHPVVRSILRAARDYGLYVADGTGSANYNGNYTGTIEMEPNLLATMYGGSNNDPYMETIQSQVYAVISQYGIYRVTAGTGPVVTNTPFPTARPTDGGGSQEVTPTSTPRPTLTSTPRPTNTVVPATSTPRPTNTVVPATSTPRPTTTVIAPSSTPRPTLTSTPRPATSTPRPTSTPRLTSTPRPTITSTPRPTLRPSSTPRPTSTVRPTITSTPRPTLRPSSTPRPTNTPFPTPRPTDTGGGQQVTATPLPTMTLMPTSTPLPTIVPTTIAQQPTSTPVPATVGASISLTTNSPRYGSNFGVNVQLNNPNLAPGGGVDAAQVECSATPSGRMTGTNVTGGTVFTPNPVVVLQTNLRGDWMLYAISQSGNNPPVTTGGTVVTMTIRALTRGTGTITCEVDIIAADGTSLTLPVTPATFTIR